ncbi:O-antigen ligase family protein [Aquimarina sediminis]|uniref:O-antigen ligase family protein n=1 Tax=Aquimarina sediminis TaxID=2070536 RepID=UPI000CA02DAE|nr:O-antigen ligase family protein [Aquimarina sediminis]
MKFIKTKKEFILPFLISALPIVAVFCSEKILSPFIFFVVFTALFEKNKLSNFRKNKLFLKPYLIFVIFCVIASILSSDFFSSIKALERYISLILIPIVLFSSDLTEKRTRFVLQSYVLIMLLVSLFSVGKLIWFVYTFEDWIEVMRGVNKNDTYLQFKYPHLMWDVHPSYWSYLIIIVNIILLGSKNCFSKLFGKHITILLLLAFNINLFYLAARIPLLVNLCVHLIYITFYFRKNTKYLLATYAIVLLILVVTYFQLPFLRYKIEHIKSDERFFLWPIVYENAKANYFVWGEGFGLGGKFIKNKLTTISDIRTQYKGNEIHNQYLTMLLETGILGVFMLLYVYIKPAFTFVEKHKKTLSLSMISLCLLVILASTIEPFFRVIKGIVIFAVFSALFRLAHEQKRVRTKI